jgi:hypothetical protein
MGFVKKESVEDDVPCTDDNSINTMNTMNNIRVGGSE